MVYPYSPMLPSVLAVVNVEGAYNRTTNTIVQLQTLFEVILLPQRSPRSYIAVISTQQETYTRPP